MVTIRRVSVLFFLLISSLASNAAWEEYKSGVSFSVDGYHDLTGGGVSPDFQNKNFGRFTNGGTLTLQFAQYWTYKNGSSNSCGGTLHYRVYRQCDTPPAFSTLALGFLCENPNTCQDTPNPGDQMWEGTTSTNLISGLTAPGTYVIELYISYAGGDTGGCASTKYISNGGANYRAYLEYETTDSFVDGNFSTPSWTGDVSNFSILNNSTTSGLIGTEDYRTHTAVLSASAAGTNHIRTQISSWSVQQEWYFWTGRNSTYSTPQHLTGANQTIIWLYANEADLESATVDGYRIQMGDDSGGDEIRLQVVTNGTATTIGTSSGSIANGLTDYGIAFYVKRSQTGVWTVKTSTLPQDATGTQSTASPVSCPESVATITQITVTDNTYTPADNSYFGFMAIHSSGVPACNAVEFDNFRFVPLPPDTYFSINGSTSGSVNENVNLAGNIAIGVDVTNAGGLGASVDVVLFSGSSSRAGGGPLAATAYSPNYTTQTLTWPAGGPYTTKFVYIDPADNALCDDLATLVFKLQNPTGGVNAYVSATDTYTLSINDDNTGYETLVNESFSGTIPASWVTTGTAWSASTDAPITGSHSARHGFQANAGQSSLTQPLDDVCLPGVNTTWRFQAKYADDCSSNNNFQIFLSSSENDLFSSTVDGYAVVIDQSSLPSAGTNDYIRLYRVTDGAYASTPIINSTTDWETNVNGGVKVGFEVTLNDAGTWELKVDANGDFDNLVSLGTGVDITGGGLTYPSMKGFGIRFKYTTSKSDLLRLDDVLITQKGCKQEWYSQSSGNVNGAIWHPTVGPATGQTVIGGRYNKFTIQSGHTVTINTDWIVRDLAIIGTLNGSSSNTKVFGNWVNDGTYNSQTSTVTFKGQEAQFVLGASPSTFNNMVIDNDGSSVTLSTATSAKGVVSPNEGTLQTGGLLTLLSTSSASASIGEIKSGAAVSGNVTLQRFVPSIPWIYGNWVNIGCPIQGQTIADWNDDILTTGFTGSDYPAPYPFNNIRKYDETATGVQNVGYVNATNVTDALETSRGYFVWMQGPAQNIDNTGAIQQGSFTQSLSYTPANGGLFHDGWNLMTNPYPSEVDWHQVSANLTGPRVYYVFDHTTNTYKFYNAQTQLGSPGSSRYIPHSQSFLVKVNTNSPAQSLSYQESFKTNNGIAFERTEDDSKSFIAIQIERNGMSDESILSFEQEATTGYDNWDAFDLESPNGDAVELSLMSADNVNLALDSRPLNENISIPVYLDLPEAGTYKFKIAHIQNLPLGTCLFVEDLVTGNTLNVTSGAEMNVSTNSPYQGNRLIIHATAPVQVITTDVSCNGSADGSIDVTTPSGEWTITLTNTSDNIDYIASGGVAFDHLNAGTYVLRVSNESSGCVASSSTIEIAEPAVIHGKILDNNVVACNNGNNGFIEWSVENSEWHSYSVKNSKGEVVATGEVDSAIASAENLPADIYTISLYTTCTVDEYPVDLRDPNSVNIAVDGSPATVLLEDGFAHIQLTANGNAQNIEWTCSNGTEAPGNSFTTSFTEPGTYSYTATGRNGNCVNSVSGLVNVQLKNAAEAQNATPVSTIVKAEEVEVIFGIDYTNLLDLRLYNSIGQEISRTSVVASKGSRTSVPTNNLSSGVYTLSITTNDQKIHTTQFVK